MATIASILRPELPPDAPLAPEDQARTRRIRAAAREASRAFRDGHPFVHRHQSEIGLGILLLSALAMTAAAYAYARGALPAVVTVLLVAFACSIAHEIEHDLIHKLYYPRRPRVRHAMLALGWLMRPSTVNPWIRIVLHLEHHRVSGTASDREERGITNGEPWGPRRFLMTGDGLLAALMRLPFRAPRRAFRHFLRAMVAFFPMGWIYHALLFAFLGVTAFPFIARLAGFDPALAPSLAAAAPTIDFLAVVWLLPNLLRTFCLHFVSSNVHYYGDVQVGDVLRQTQVLRSLRFLPFQLFCFNFGATHAIHHFWVSEPFYVRQITAAQVYGTMRENGVRFDDLGTFARANRYGKPVAAGGA